MNTKPQLPSDGQLVIAAHNGMVEAWNELRRRHFRSVQGVSKTLRWSGSKSRAQRALETLHGEILAGEVAGGDEPAVRAVRARALAALTGGTYGPAPAPSAAPAPADVELTQLADAFATLPEPWQTALWHRWVELQPAAEYAPLLGRTANEATAVVQRAEAGLFDGFLRQELQRPDGVDEACARIVPLLGGSLRMTLSAHEQRVVDDHIEHRADHADGDDGIGCAACRRRLAVGAALSSLLPLAVVPKLTGLSPVKYRAAVGARTRLVSATALHEERTDRARRLAYVGALAVLVLAVVAAVVLIRSPFDGDATPTSTGGAGTDGPTDPATSTASTEPSTTETTPDSTTDPSTTTTTELALRPPPTGPENLVELVFAAGDNLLGFAPTPPNIEVEVSSPAPIFAGGTGTIDVAITNTGTSPSVVDFVVKVPRGVELDVLAGGPGECVDPPEESALCTTTVEAGATVVLALRFSLTNSVVGRFVVEGNLVAEALEVGIDAAPRLVHSSVGNGEILTIGNTLMTCDPEAPACLDARNGVGDVVNRWDLPSQQVDIAPELGWFNSSSARLDLADGSNVEAAYLFWSGDLRERGVEIPDDGSSARISVLAPNASAVAEIDAKQVRLGDVDATQYFGVADVTDIVRSAGAGSYLVGNVQSVDVQGSYAAWSLMVVTEDSTMPRRQFVITNPFAWFSPDDMYGATIPVVATSARPASLDVVAFEGERGFVPEELTAGGEQLDGDGAFDSTITGARTPEYVNNFGIDVDPYDLSIDTPDGALRIEARSGKDGVRLAVLGLAVDLV